MTVSVKDDSFVRTVYGIAHQVIKFVNSKSMKHETFIMCILVTVTAMYFWLLDDNQSVNRPKKQKSNNYFNYNLQSTMCNLQPNQK